MSAAADAARRRSDRLAEEIERRLARIDGELAAIEVVPEDEGRRDEDLRLVRAALDAGASPADLGAVFITVATNFTYEVDWRDQFSFWPRMHDHLRSDALNLREDHAARRSVEQAFQAFSRAYRGVRPVGELLRHFPLMSWPLVHSLMPWCAQRHVARLLERAASEGALPDDPGAPWPQDDVAAIAASMRVPVFVLGVLENPTVLSRVGRALLGDTPRPDAPAWVRRLRRRIEGDAMARALLGAAREFQREHAGTRVTRGATLPVTLTAQEARGEVTLWASMGPYPRAVSADAAALAFARAGAKLYLRRDGKDVGSVPLFDAFDAPALVELQWSAADHRLQPSARAFEGSDIPDVIKSSEEGAERKLSLPLVFRKDSGSRYALASDAVPMGEEALLLMAPGAACDRAKERGFKARTVRGAPKLVALVGVASAAATAVFAEAGVSVRERAPTLRPALLPATRRDGDRWVFRSGRDVWLRLEDGGARVSRATVENRDGAGEASVGEDESGAALIRVPAGTLAVGLNKVRAFADGRARAVASADVLVEAPSVDARLSRWRVALNPIGASIEHLRARQCWLEINALPEVIVDVELAAGSVTRAVRFAAEETDVFTTARRLSDAAALIFEGTSADEVSVRARAADEPEGWVEVATLRAREEGLHFDASGDAPRVIAPDDAPALERLTFNAEGLGRESVDLSTLGDPGVYLATAGATCAAVCVTPSIERLPRLPAGSRFVRSIARAADLLRVLRAVDVAAIWPLSTRSSGTLMRHATARSIERELVGVLCGAAWVEVEDGIVRAGASEAILSKLARLLWLAEDKVAEIVEQSSESPLEMLRALLEEVGEPESEDAKHLVLTFHRRGMTSPTRDESALRWAWASARRARIARACRVLAPGAQAEMQDGGGDEGA